jgi:cell division protein FtsB
MRYWGTETRVTNKKKAGSAPKRRAARKQAPAAVASGGSVKPFLRKFYRHQAVVGGPVQRFFVLLVIAGLIYAFVLGDGGAIRIAMLRHDRGKLDAQIAEMRQNVALLETEITRLETDPYYIEKTGRERYGYMRPDESVYKLIPNDKKKKK